MGIYQTYTMWQNDLKKNPKNGTGYWRVLRTKAWRLQSACSRSGWTMSSITESRSSGLTTPSSSSSSWRCRGRNFPALMTSQMREHSLHVPKTHIHTQQHTDILDINRRIRSVGWSLGLSGNRTLFHRHVIKNNFCNTIYRSCKLKSWAFWQ